MVACSNVRCTGALLRALLEVGRQVTRVYTGAYGFGMLLAWRVGGARGGWQALPQGSEESCTQRVPGLEKGQLGPKHLNDPLGRNPLE